MSNISRKIIEELLEELREEFRRELRELKRLLRCDSDERREVLLVVGEGKVEVMSATINPGQTKTLTAVYTDANNKSEPLASLPTAVDAAGVVPVTAIGSPTVNDGTYTFSFTAPADAVVGSVITINTHADGDPDPKVDPIDKSIDVTVVAPEDTQVALSVN